jgi:hypothetical protein
MFAGFFPLRHNPLSLSEERVKERFHATYTTHLVQPTSMAASLAPHLSRRDRNRVDLG